MNGFPLKNVIWTVTDGRAGMLNQCTGLAAAMGMPWENKTVHPRFPWSLLPVSSWPAPFLSLGSDSSSFDPPWPKVVIGCGWRSIPFVIEVKRRSGGKTFTVQLQDPKVPAEIFDLVVPPEHDGLSGPNVEAIIGSPNSVTAASLSRAARQWTNFFSAYPSPRVTVLIGGKSKSHRFSEGDAATLAQQILDLGSRGYSILATTSRRTGDAQTRILQQALNTPNAFLWNGNGDNPYLGMLALADAILVTSDSTNMMVEAAGTGKPVHIVPLPCSNEKFTKLIERLKQLGIARDFTGEIQQWNYQPLNETARIAGLIRRKLNPS